MRSMSRVDTLHGKPVLHNVNFGTSTGWLHSIPVFAVTRLRGRRCRAGESRCLHIIVNMTQCDAVHAWQSQSISLVHGKFSGGRPYKELDLGSLRQHVQRKRAWLKRFSAPAGASRWSECIWLPQRVSSTMSVLVGTAVLQIDEVYLFTEMLICPWAQVQWVRLDPHGESLAAAAVLQPEAMWAAQLERSRDVVAQSAAVAGDPHRRGVGIRRHNAVALACSIDDHTF